MSQTTTDRAAIIRQELKSRHGWTSRDVSVRADYYSMGSAIRVRIKNADVDLHTVKAVAENHERIDRCSITGEILSGGNRYVTVGYDSTACDVLRARKLAVVEKAAEALQAVSEGCLIDIEGTPYMLGRGRHGHGFAVWKHDDGRSGSHCCETYDLKDAALYVAIGSWNQ